MASKNPSYACTACGAATIKWHGRCPRCGEFGTVEAVAPAAVAQVGQRASLTGRTPTRPAQSASQVLRSAPEVRLRTGISEFDRVLGGGLVAGQVLLLSGEPGAGKSTLLLAVAHQVAARTGRPALYLSGEESVSQIAVRARRIGAVHEQLLLADETELSGLIGQLDAVPDAALAIVDSVQTVASAEIEGRAGGVAQVMAVASALTRVAKDRGLPIILVGQVTKDATVAGPRALEHIVDTTLSLDGDRHTSLRLLRTVKNRFGSIEVAAFEQTDRGMSEVVDPSVLFRGERDTPVDGTAVTVTMTGNRALIAEIQALVTKSTAPNPRRAVTGLDAARSAMLIAITSHESGEPLHTQDVFLATVGGMRLNDPGADLACCLALLSAAGRGVSPLDLAAIGEVTLTGDIRSVPHLGERVAEAIRLGYRRLLVPPGTTKRVNGRAEGGNLIEVARLDQAMAAFRQMAPTGPRLRAAPASSRVGDEFTGSG